MWSGIGEESVRKGRMRRYLVCVTLGFMTYEVSVVVERETE